MTSHEGSHRSNPWRHLPDGFADFLDLEAQLAAPLREFALDLAEDVLDGTPATIVDLGSGTGAGLLTLASRFPSAHLHAVDVSGELLSRATTAAQHAGIAHRLSVHQEDLTSDWTSQVPADADLIWASLALHHVDDSAAALCRAFSALRPGGVLVLTELTGAERLAPDDLGTGRRGLAARVMSTRPQHGVSAAPDWATLLDGAGFTATQHRETDFVAAADRPHGAEYLALQLRSRMEHTGDDLDSDDLTALGDVIESLTAGAATLSFHAGRAVWVAARATVS